MEKERMQFARVRPESAHPSPGAYGSSTGFNDSRAMLGSLMEPRYRVKIKSTRLDARLLSEIFHDHLETNGGGVGRDWEGDVVSGDLITSV